MKFIITAFVLLFSAAGFAQERVHQVIIANGGNYEFNPPFTDRTTMASYDPATETYTVFDTVQTEWVGTTIIYDTLIYALAGDSLILYHLDNHTRLATAYIPGNVSLARNESKLVVTKGYGADTNFVEIRDPYDLSLIANIPEIGLDCSKLAIHNDSAYVAVPGNFFSTEGKLAIIDLTNDTLSRILDYGVHGQGIIEVLSTGTHIISSSTLGSTSDTSGISIFDIAADEVQHVVLQKPQVTLYDAYGDTLYMQYYDRMATYSISSQQLVDTLFGTSSLLTVPVDVSYHQQNGVFYATHSNFFNYGRLTIFNRAGMVLDTITTGISNQSLALDIRSGFQRPFAVNDSIDILWNTTSYLDVQANDFDPNGTGLTTNIVTGLLQGPHSVANNDSIEFSPFNQFTGFDFMEYSVCSNGLCDTAEVVVSVKQILSVETGLEQPEFAIGPMPAISEIHVRSNGFPIEQATLWSIEGKKQEVSVSGLNSSYLYIGRNNATAGVYLLELNCNNHRSIHKVILQ